MVVASVSYFLSPSLRYSIWGNLVNVCMKQLFCFSQCHHFWFLWFPVSCDHFLVHVEIKNPMFLLRLVFLVSGNSKVIVSPPLLGECGIFSLVLLSCFTPVTTKFAHTFATSTPRRRKSYTFSSACSHRYVG